MLLSASGLISKSFGLYKTNFGLFFKYVLLSYLPAIVIAIAGVFLGGAASFLFFNDNAGSATAAIVVLVLLVIAAIVVSIWIFLAFIRVIASRYLGKTPDAIGAELKKAVPLILPYLGASILFGLILLGGTILFIIPGIIFAIWFAFYTYEITLDNKGVMDSLKGSKTLVSGRWWAILWRLLAPAFVFGVIALIAQALVQFPFEILARNTASTGMFITATVLSVVISAAINAIMAPLTAASQVILYVEAKNTPVTTAPQAPTPPAA